MNVLEMIGPVMIGPSSSHTAGAVQIGRVAAKILGEPPKMAELTLSGSFADTGMGHGTDKALVAGLLGLRMDDSRIPQSFSLARERGLKFHYEKKDIPQAHPNTVRIQLSTAAGKTAEITASSVGGGSIQVTELDGMPVSFNCELDTLVIIHQDFVGVISEITHVLASDGINIATIRCSRTGKGSRAVTTVEVDGKVTESCMDKLKGINHVFRCILIHKIEV